ncbi:MAG: Rrf2 family transcriptional regulator [Chlamydiota bacterium]
MKISTRVRYGVRLLVELGLHSGDEPVLLRDISKNQEISEKYLGQIMIPLKAAGLVRTYRGAHGGYRLGRRAADITLKEIVEVLDGDMCLLDCAREPGSCSRIVHCVTKSVWQELGKRISSFLESMTLEDLIAQCGDRREVAQMYQI